MDTPREDDSAATAFQQRWQEGLLPVMRAALIFFAVFFLAASLWQYHQLYQDLRQGVPTAARTVTVAPTAANISHNTARSAAQEATQHAAEFDALRWRTMVALEQDVVQMRYRQINAVLLLRTWTRQTGFLVGMMLSLVGAFFILGKIKEDTTQLSGESGSMKLALTSSSPGIVLAVLGTVLMATTLLVKFDYEVSDKPVYLLSYGLNPAGGGSRAGALPPPMDMPAGEAAKPGAEPGADDIPQPPAAAPNTSSKTAPETP